MLFKSIGHEVSLRENYGFSSRWDAFIWSSQSTKFLVHNILLNQEWNMVAKIYTTYMCIVRTSRSGFIMCTECVGTWSLFSYCGCCTTWNITLKATGLKRKLISPNYCYHRQICTTKRYHVTVHWNILCMGILEALYIACLWTSHRLNQRWFIAKWKIFGEIEMKLRQFQKLFTKYRRQDIVNLKRRPMG